jgi:hypothetical protein
MGVACNKSFSANDKLSAVDKTLSEWGFHLPPPRRPNWLSVYIHTSVKTTNRSVLIYTVGCQSCAVPDQLNAGGRAAIKVVAVERK